MWRARRGTPPAATPARTTSSRASRTAACSCWIRLVRSSAVGFPLLEVREQLVTHPAVVRLDRQCGFVCALRLVPPLLVFQHLAEPQPRFIPTPARRGRCRPILVEQRNRLAQMLFGTVVPAAEQLRFEHGG